LVLREDVLDVGNLFLRLVGPAEGLSKKQLVGLHVTVDVDVVNALELEKFVHGFPVVVAFDRHLEETHVLRTELTHLISYFYY
jgi:hypothetical protein